MTPILAGIKWSSHLQTQLNPAMPRLEIDHM
ncbi:hypothetical protein MAAFP003_2502 [Mycobacterium ahvazicum]|uniref:Uncharacterized protein n=1 Tax=Mycobacterium ahvazicum TaxID=1964395 RepID=A0A2K4YAK6_9MYCO|nr:hypothetical protein MAAFP003_2502 [Mycobacterium ahvazicum]